MNSLKKCTYIKAKKNKQNNPSYTLVTHEILTYNGEMYEYRIVMLRRPMSLLK